MKTEYKSLLLLLYRNKHFFQYQETDSEIFFVSAAAKSSIGAKCGKHILHTSVYLVCLLHNLQAVFINRE